MAIATGRPMWNSSNRAMLNELRVVGLCSLLALGCSSASESGGGSGGLGQGGSAAGTGTGGGTSGTGGSVDVDAGTGGSSTADECTNVDILFMIDNSGSMADQQASLIASFQGFIDGIKNNLALAESYHIGVITSDDYYQNAPGCTSIGNLITQTSGINASNLTCSPFTSGGNFMDATEPMLADKFACAAKVGTTGSDDERPMRAVLDAINPANNAPGTCNAGFSRPDSLLIVVIITDEDDVKDGCDPSTGQCLSYGSGGDPDTWYNELVSHKAGIAGNIVVLSLIGLTGNNSCGAQPASKLIGFTNNFGQNGYKGDVCSSSYDQFFSETLPLIDTACQNYEPPK
jgi:hypothetical protein